MIDNRAQDQEASMLKTIQQPLMACLEDIQVPQNDCFCRYEHPRCRNDTLMSSSSSGNHLTSRFDATPSYPSGPAALNPGGLQPRPSTTNSLQGATIDGSSTDTMNTDEMAMVYLMGVTAVIMVFFVCLGLVLSAVSRIRQGRRGRRRRHRRQERTDQPPTYMQVARLNDMLPSYSEACLKSESDTSSNVSFHSLSEFPPRPAGATAAASSRTPSDPSTSQSSGVRTVEIQVEEPCLGRSGGSLNSARRAESIEAADGDDI